MFLFIVSTMMLAFSIMGIDLPTIPTGLLVAGAMIRDGIDGHARAVRNGSKDAKPGLLMLMFGPVAEEIGKDIVRRREARKVRDHGRP